MEASITVMMGLDGSLLTLMMGLRNCYDGSLITFLMGLRNCYDDTCIVPLK